ncbi:MAG: hypothetical protein V3U90_06115 [Dehalococcoidia bacterium]
MKERTLLHVSYVEDDDGGDAVNIRFNITNTFGSILDRVSRGLKAFADAVGRLEGREPKAA